MPWTQHGLPFAGRTQTPRHCSWVAAERSAVRATTQTARLMALYVTRGPQTDADAALALGLDRSTINARRATLVRSGAIVARWSAVNPRSGVRNTLWGLPVDSL